MPIELPQLLFLPFLEAPFGCLIPPSFWFLAEDEKGDAKQNRMTKIIKLGPKSDHHVKEADLETSRMV